MIKKYIIDPERIRRIPKQFSWVDHRLVQDGYIQRCHAESLALYLFLTAVSDSQGLSYYGDSSISKHLHLSTNALAHARQELIKQALIAYRKPLYQVLDLRPNPWNDLASRVLKRTTPSRQPDDACKPNSDSQLTGAVTCQKQQNEMQQIGEIIAQIEGSQP